MITAPKLLESAEQAELYLRGRDTLLASWEAYARGAAGAAVHRLPGASGCRASTTNSGETFSEVPGRNWHGIANKAHGDPGREGLLVAVQVWRRR